MLQLFKNIQPGIFRAKNNLCYTKLESEVLFGEEKANAVIILQTVSLNSSKKMNK